MTREMGRKKPEPPTQGCKVQIATAANPGRRVYVRDLAMKGMQIESLLDVQRLIARLALQVAQISCEELDHHFSRHLG